MISIRRMTLGSGYRYLMESVAVGDGAPGHTSNLTRYYATSGTPPGVFLGAGLGGLDDGRGVEPGSAVTEQHLFNLLGMCADPITGEALSRQPNRTHLSLAKRVAARGCRHSGDRHQCRARRANGPDRGRGTGEGRNLPHARGRVRPDLLTVEVGVDSLGIGRPGDQEHRFTPATVEPIEVVLTYAEREVFHSRSGTNGVVQEDVEGVVAAAFTHWDSRAGDPQLHDHVVVANRARSVSDGAWRTLDSRGLFKSVVALSELHQGVLSDLLTNSLGWGWDGRARRHSEQPRFEVTGVSEALMAEFCSALGRHR